MAADVKWIKLSTDLFSDEKILLIEREPEGESMLMIWVKLLCLMGRTNTAGALITEDGMVYDAGDLAAVFGRAEDLVRRALEVFEKYRMIEMTDGVICLPNWEKHQKLDAIEKRRAYQRKLMAERRAKRKKLIAERTGAADGAGDGNEAAGGAEREAAAIGEGPAANGAEPEGTADSSEAKAASRGPREEKAPEETKKRGNTPRTDPLFEKFWEEYPKKAAKENARKAFMRLKPDEELLGRMREALERFRQTEQWRKEDGQYIPYAATWLNQRRWEDDMPEAEKENEKEDEALPEGEIYIKDGVVHLPRSWGYHAPVQYKKPGSDEYEYAEGWG